MLFHQFKNKIVLSALLSLYGISHLCFASMLETQLSRDQVTLGDSVFVTYISNNNANNNSPDFSALQKDFRILNTNYGNAVNIINGVTSTKTFWRLQLEPKKAGELVIPEINVGSDKSTARKLMVAASQANQNSQNNAVTTQQNAPVYVRGEISSTTPYVQSQVLYTFKLYFRTQLSDPRVEIPQVKDVTFFQLGDSQGYQTTINGTAYNVVEKNFAIFPKKPGTITILPMQLHALAVDENASAFDGPFNFIEPKTIAAATKDFNLSVRDVPPDYQGNAWLPAKNISLTEQWSDNTGHWESGTPVTRTITIEAQGLRADQLPDLSIDKMNGVNVYVDRPRRSNHIQNNMVVGVLEQKVTYIPNTVQSFTIPRLKVNWWNTQTNTNAVSQLNEMVIQVTGVARVSNGVSKSLDHNTSQPASTAPNTFSAATHAASIVSNPFYTSIWFWIACALLGAWIATLLFILRKKPAAVSEKEAQTHTSIELNEKSFEQACHSNHAMQAQQYLLGWAKKYWPDVPLNLATLSELMNDEQFSLAIQALEQALYAKKAMSWNGQTLLAAYLRIKKSRKHFAATDINASKGVNLTSDPLPPLNPVHY